MYNNIRNYVFGPMLLVLGILIGRASVPSPQSHQPAHKHPQEQIWTCSMHPQIRKSEPGPCPICGMDLIAVRSDKNQSSDIPSGQLVLSERAKALAKLRTTEVKRQSNKTLDVRLLGRVEPNETSLRTITAWTGGRIDKLHVNTTGQHVRRGQIIATLYSPEVFAAHQDLLAAKKQLHSMQTPTNASTKQVANATLEAARERLRLLGVPEVELVKMEERKQPIRSIPIRSPFTGTILERYATQGAYVQTGTALFQVANLSNLWIQLDAYESDLQRLAVGQQVEVQVEAYPEEIFQGKVTFIDPTLDTQRRTARVRVEVNNRDSRLRPGMFAQALVSAQQSSKIQAPLLIPATAPLFTGRRSIVYVEHQHDNKISYEARVVRLGPRLSEYYPVVAGLSQGEKVVTKGAFTLDADLQIRGGPSMMTQPDDTESEKIIRISQSQLKKLAPVVNTYLNIQRSLAEDNLQKTSNAAVQMNSLITSTRLSGSREISALWKKLQTNLHQHNNHIQQARSLEDARMGFEGLSDTITILIQRLGNPLEHSISLAHCPMAIGSDGASWLQQGDAIDNSYFGESMRTCGEIKQIIFPGERLIPSKDQHKGHKGHNH